MKYKECVDCYLSLVCVTYKVNLGYCFSLKRRVLIVVGARVWKDSVFVPPNTCPVPKQRTNEIKLKCGEGYGVKERYKCGTCKVTMAVLREKIAEEKRGENE